jgi:hypothetical protein
LKLERIEFGRLISHITTLCFSIFGSFCFDRTASFSFSSRSSRRG